MGFIIQQGKGEVEAAYRFQVSAELRDVQLLDCTASVSESGTALEGQLDLGLRMETAVLNTADGKARFSVLVNIFGDPAGTPEGERHRFEVTCRYALTYELRQGYTPSQPELDAFREGNAVFHCWPYSRELVQNMTARMGLPVPPLPFLRLVPQATPKTTAQPPSKSRSRAPKTGRLASVPKQ